MLRLDRQYLRPLAETICRWPRLFLAAGVILAALSAIYAWHGLEFKTSRNDLIGRDSDYWRYYGEYVAEFHAEEDYLILVEGKDPPRNRQAVDALVGTLLDPAENRPGAAQSFTAEDVFYRVDFSQLEERFLFFLSLDELGEIRDSLKDFRQLVVLLQEQPQVGTFFEAMNQMLQQMETTPESERRRMEAFLPTVGGIIAQMATPASTGAGKDLLSPWASAFFSEGMLEEAQQEFRWNGYHVFDQGRMYVILIHPRASSNGNEMVPHGATIAKLRRLIAHVQQEFPDLKIGLTGEPVLDHDEMAVSQSDSLRATLLTLIVICLLFFSSFREFLRPVLAAGSLVLILFVCLGYTTLSVGHLNIITITFAVMILGLGIDLGIQFIARYEEELGRGATRAQAVQLSMEQTGPSIITAGATNAAAFFAMGLSGFRGVTELGIIAGGGMLIATAGTLLVLPAMLVLIHRRSEAPPRTYPASAFRVENVLLRYPAPTLAIFAVLTLGAVLLSWQVPFDYNVLNLQSRGLESVETELRLLHTDAQSTIYAAVVCDTLEQTRDWHRRLEELPTVSSVASIAPLLPEQQEEKAAVIRAIQGELGRVKFDLDSGDDEDPAAVLRSVAALRLRASRLRREAEERSDPASLQALGSFVNKLEESQAILRALPADGLAERLHLYRRAFFESLETQLTLLATQKVDTPMTLADVPPEVRRMLVGRTSKFLLRVFPRENIWERDALAGFVRDVQTVAPNATGTPLGLYEFVDILLRGYRNAALWALLVITVMIFIDFHGSALPVLPLAGGAAVGAVLIRFQLFATAAGVMTCGGLGTLLWILRNPKGLYATVLTILPLLVGIAWTLAIMNLLGLPFNPANIMMLPLLVGIGAAYGIYIVQRYREDVDAEFWRKSTGRAVVLSALTTIVAFASLILGAHRGIRSLGLLMSLGVTACLLAALLLLPALLEITRRKRWKV